MLLFLVMENMANTPALMQFVGFFTNPIILSGISAWLGAQFIKTAIKLFSGKIHSFGELMEMIFWKTGGMPSSHSAVVSAVCTTIGFRNGFNSDMAAFAAVFLFVTIRDAFGVRRSSGLQGAKLNELGIELKEKGVIDDYKRVKETMGHSPMEVLCGSVFGILIGMAFSLLSK
jgi:uncharacterized protein